MKAVLNNIEETGKRGVVKEQKEVVLRACVLLCTLCIRTQECRQELQFKWVLIKDAI